VSRKARLTAVILTVVAFMIASALVARVLAAGSDERAAAIAVIKAQVAGRERAMLALLPGCAQRPPCLGRVRDNVRRLRRRGAVKVLTVRAPGFALGARTGTTRIAWKTGTALPVVQCVTARRTGDAFGGYRVRLEDLSAPIGLEASC
jgi:hypothetical protein